MSMNAIKIALIVAFQSALASEASGQGTFQNLDFEAAQLIPIPGDPDGAVQFSAAFLGWTGYIDGQVQTRSIPNGVPIGTSYPFIAIIAPPGAAAWQGEFMVGFGAGRDSSGNITPVALTQTGQVPSDAKALQFLGRYASAISVWLGGQPLSAYPLNNNLTGGRLYGIDVSVYAGQMLELRFQPGPGIDYLDAIRFSDQPIPEPSSVGLFAFGALLLGWRVVRRR